MGSALANAIEGGPQRVKRTSPNIRRLLDEMEAEGYQFLSVPRRDGEFLYFIVKATRSRKVPEVGTSHGEM